MSELLVTHFDVASGEVEIRNMNDEELKQLNADIENKKTKTEIELTLEKNKKQLLERLGITEDEAKLLLS